MKTLLVVLMFLIICTAGTLQAQGMSWTQSNEKTLAWDPVNTLAFDGSPILTGDVITYNTYVKNYDTGEITIAASGLTEPQYTYSFQQEGRFILCVETIRVPGSNQTVSVSSEMSCTDNPLRVQGGVPIGVFHYWQTNPAGGLVIR